MSVALAANIVLGFAVLGALVFVVSYHVLTGGTWRETPLGRNVMAMMAACVALLALAVARTFIPWLADHLQWLRLGAFTVVAYIVWRRVHLLYRYQYQWRREHPDGQPTQPSPTEEPR